MAMHDSIFHLLNIMGVICDRSPTAHLKLVKLFLVSCAVPPTDLPSSKCVWPSLFFSEQRHKPICFCTWPPHSSLVNSLLSYTASVKISLWALWPPSPQNSVNWINKWHPLTWSTQVIHLSGILPTGPGILGYLPYPSIPCIRYSSLTWFLHQRLNQWKWTEQWQLQKRPLFLQASSPENPISKLPPCDSS